MGEEAPVELLFAGPRGRRLCLSVAISVHDALWRSHLNASWKLGNERLLARFLRDLGMVDTAGVASTTDELAFLDALADAAGDAVYWEDPDAEDQLLADPRVVDALRPLAAAVLAAPAAAWWATPMADTDQHLRRWIDPGHGRPPQLHGAAQLLQEWRAATVEDERQAYSRPTSLDAPYSGCWWSTPNWPGLITTSRSIGPVGPTQLHVMEDPIGFSRAQTARVQPRAGCRVYEIAEPDDWVALVARYPLDVGRSRRHDWWRTTHHPGPWLIPDWAAVATDYDATHLTVLGYLATSGRALPVGDAATVLAGWEPDVTYWLADALDQTAPPTTWQRSEQAPYNQWEPEP